MWRPQAAPLLTLALLVAGCGLAPPRATDSASLAKGLPPELRLSTVIQGDAEGKGVTVADKLAEVGAYAGEDGKLYDRGGRELYFYKRQSLWWGAPPPNYAEVVQKEEDELRDLRKRYTVIVVGPPSSPP